MRLNFTKTGLLLGLICLVVVTSPSTVSAQADQQGSDRWYESMIKDSRIGYTRESASAKDNQWISESETRMVLNRLGSKTEMYSLTRTTESQTGQLLEVSFEMNFSENATKTQAAIDKNQIKTVSTVGGRDYEKTTPFEGELLGSEGIRLRSISELVEPGDSMTCQTYMPMFGTGATAIAREMVSKETITLGDKSYDAIVIEEKIGMLPASRIWVDKEFRWIKSLSDTPFGKSINQLTSQAKALGAAEGNILPPEIFKRTMIRSNVRLPFMLPIESMTIELTLIDSDLGWPELNGDNQQVVRQDKNKTVLKVSRPPSQRASIQKNSSPDESDFLASNEIINSDDDEINRVAQEVAKQHSDPLHKCLALKNWVDDNVQGDAGIVLAPSSEVIRNRRGTCSEFATLLCSMIRASDIPCRYVQGLVYMNGIWGGHAWVEAKIDNQWIPLDAAVNNAGAASAARIHFLTTSLKGGIGEILGVNSNQMYGNMRIRITSYTVGGKIIDVPADQDVYTTNGRTYENPGLRLRVTCDSDFTFSGLDKVYPSNLILEMTDANKQRIQLMHFAIPPGDDSMTWIQAKLSENCPGESTLTEKTFFGQTTQVATSKTGMAVAIRRGNDLILLQLDSENPSKLLDKVVSWIDAY